MPNHTGTVCLSAGDILLRPFTLNDDRDMFYGWASDPWVTRYLTWLPHQSVAETRDFLQHTLQQYQDPPTYQWAIVYQGQLVGSISAVHLNDGDDNCEVGYCLSHNYWGRGIMTAALKLVLQHFLFTVGYHRVSARHAVQNPASGRVMQKCGMLPEGTQRQCTRTGTGQFVDCRCYAILRSDLENES